MDPFQTFVIMMHFLTGGLRGDDRRLRGEVGAVSIEQVLWYAAAAVSVAVVAGIIWGQIRTTASTPVQSPAAP